LTIDEASGPPFEVWPDNWESVRIFNAMDTQWRVSNGGRSGLDYNVLHSVFDVKWGSNTFDDIRIMESAALLKIHEQTEN
jgi:hypothetical protein